MQTLRSLVAAPFLIIAAVAYLLMGLQLVLAIVSLLSGTPLVDALLGWVLGTAFFGIVGSVAGVIGMVIRGEGPLLAPGQSPIQGSYQRETADTPTRRTPTP